MNYKRFYKRLYKVYYKDYGILKLISDRLEVIAKNNSTDNNLNETAALKKIMDAVDRELERFYKVIIYIYY